MLGHCNYLNCSIIEAGLQSATTGVYAQPQKLILGVIGDNTRKTLYDYFYASGGNSQE